jgi:hypothetical protein
VEVTAVLAEQIETMRDGLAVTAEDAGGLPMGHLGDQGPEEITQELGLLEAVVDAESLDREGVVAFEAEEALDDPPIAGTGVVALVRPSLVAR